MVDFGLYTVRGTQMSKEKTKTPGSAPASTSEIRRTN